MGPSEASEWSINVVYFKKNISFFLNVHLLQKVSFFNIFFFVENVLFTILGWVDNFLPYF